MRRLLPLLPALIALSPALSHAQNVGFWGTSGAGGEYAVRVDKIISVSSHTYVVDGAAKVTEVNIATDSPVLVRYYHIDLITPETPGAIGKSVINKVTEVATEAAGRVVPSDLKVIKNYPTTTHARTIEFRLRTRDEVEKILKSAKQAFFYNKGEVLKLD